MGDTAVGMRNDRSVAKPMPLHSLLDPESLFCSVRAPRSRRRLEGVASRPDPVAC